MSIKKNEQGLPVCITGKNPYGLCSCCHSDDIHCCAKCEDKNNCNSVCGYLEKENEKE